MWIKKPQHKRDALSVAARLRKHRAVSTTALAGLSVFTFFLGAHYHASGFLYGVGDMLRANVRIPVNYVRGLSADPPKLTIDVKHKHFQKIAYNREVALERGVLLADARDEVPAFLRYDGDKIVKAKIRLKGDLPDHWRDESKWSFRIRIRGEETFLGMKQFSIQHPRTRDWLSEWFVHRFLAWNGLVGKRYHFIEVELNGKSLGLYAIEEHMEKRLLESNSLREGPLFRANTDFYWYQKPGIANAAFGTAVDAYQMKRLRENPALLGQYHLARNLFEAFREGDLPTHEVFDTEKLARFFAILDLVGSRHGGSLDNLVFYYNPVTSRIEPVGADTGLFEMAEPIGAIRLPDHGGHIDANDVWFDLVFRDPVFFEAYLRALDRISAPELLDQFFEEHEETFQANLRALHKFFPWYDFEPSREVLHRNQRRIREFLETVAEPAG